MAEHIPTSDPDPSDPPASDPPDSASMVMEFLGMGLGSAVCVAAGAGLGIGVDAAAHTGPIFTLVGLGLGVVAGVVYTVAKVRQNL